jgi:hypothetical protein
MLNKATLAPLLDFSMNVSVGLATEAFTVETPLVPLTSGPPKLPEAAAELVMNGSPPIRAVPAALVLDMEAGVAPAPDGTWPPAPPATPVLAIPLVGNEVLVVLP